MSLDFLRRLAFNGELARFVHDDPYDFASLATGLHLEFNPRFLQRFHGHDRDWTIDNWYDRHDFASRLAESLEEWGSPDWRHYGVETPREAVRIIVDLSPDYGVDKFEGRRNYEGFPIIYREMGPIQPHYAPGSWVLADSTRSGTICGFLKDIAGGRSLALTCGHVARTKGTMITDPACVLQALGQVCDVVLPAGQGPCNRYAQLASNSLDAALIEITDPAVLNAGGVRTVEPIAAISPGDLVEFIGQGSRRPGRGVVKSATIWKQIDLLGDGTVHCCGDIFEIGHCRHQYIPTPLSKPGDSGAAVTKKSASDHWLGMLIGGDGGSSFVCYAEQIMDWVERRIPGARLFP